MKTLRTIALMMVFALTFGARAQSDDVVKFSGTVVDAKSNPVADAWVDCYYFPTRGIMGLPDVKTTQHVTTDAKGAFSFSVPHGAVTVIVKKEGFASMWKTWQTTPVGTVDPLVMATPSTLAGTVVDEKDRPVADAEVSVSAAVDQSGGEWTTQPNYIFGKAASDLFSTRTSADGHFRIAGFPAGAQANLAVIKTGRALRQSTVGRNGMQLEASSGQKDIKLVTDPAASIEGAVVFRDTGAPVAHARLQVQPVNGGFGVAIVPEMIQSAADGTFQIPGVSAGSYRVTATSTNDSMASWVAESVPVTVGAGETVHDVKIQAGRGGVVEVTVVSKTGQKELPGVNVQAYSDGYQAGGVTRSNGVALLRVPVGPATVYAMTEGLAQGQTQATVAEGETNRVRLELNSPSKITGVVRDSSGSPVADTTVGVFPNYGGNNKDVKTDADGHYEVTWQQPSWAGMQNQKYYLLARNVERQLAAIQQIDESTTTLDLDLKPGMTISGRVEDAKGHPITNATGYLMVQMGNFGFPVNRQPIRADEQGRIEVGGLPSGQLYTLNASANGYGNGREAMDAADPKRNHYDFNPLVLKLADRKLAGRVLGADGKPVSGAQVWMNGEDQPNGNATTDADGRFTFDAVCEGPLSVSANGGRNGGGNGSTEANGGDTNVVIRFGSNRNFNQPNSLTLTGTVYDPAGNPAANARVMVTPAWGMVDSTTTDTNGEYSVHWQAQQGPRGMKYFVIARDTERNQAGMEEIDEKKTHVSVRMEAGFSISGTVQDANGAPLSGANVNLNIQITQNMSGMVDQQGITSGADGTFTIPALPKGQQYHLNISANGHGSAQKPISKIQSQTNSLELTPFKLKTADRKFAGQVLGQDGKPVSGAYVNIYGNGQPNGNMRTDSTGHFKFTVCEGLINVNAFMPNGGNNYGMVQAHGGDENVVLKMGNRNQQRQVVSRVISLKPQPWTFGSLIAWPAKHKTGAIVLLSLQLAVLLGMSGGIIWATRLRKS